MILTAELENIFREESESIQAIEITYLNGGKVRGTIKSLKTDPLDLVLRKMSEKNKKGGKHHVVFDHVVDISIFFSDNSKKYFKQGS